MDEELKNRFIDTLTKGNIEHYSDYSLKQLANSVGYTIRKITLLPYKMDFGFNSGLNPVDTLMAKIVMYNDSGMLSYLTMLPHYGISIEEISTSPKVCDDL